MNPLDYVALFMGQILKLIYYNISFLSYGLAIIILTILIRLILLPLYVKQYRSTAKMQEIQPQIQEIQKRYKTDKEKLNQELMKVYQENKVNPAGGCLPLLLQMPILFSLYWVISQPLKFMLVKSPQLIQELLEHVPTEFRIMGMPDLSIINYFNNHPDQLANVGDLLKKDELINMHFLGLNLGLRPEWNPDLLFNNPMSHQYLALLLIPILAAVTTFISVKFSTPQPAAKNNENNMQNSMQNSMMIMMPFMTAFFAFSVPAGLGLYWIIGNVIQVFQQLYINKFIMKKKKEVADK